MSELVYFTVVGSFKSLIEDAASDSNYDPEIIPVGATVTFTPVLNTGDILLATDYSPPTGFIPAPVIASIDPADGMLKLRSGTDSGASGGYSYAPVRLLGNSPLLELSRPLVYNVTFSGVVFNGRQGRITGFNFEAPNSDTVLDLISVFRRPGSPASGITKIGPTGVRFQDGNLIFSYAGVDIPSPLPLSEITGPAGDVGPVGASGASGASGAAATIAVGSVVTGEPGSAVSVVNSGSSGAAVFDFSIPAGASGVPGATGPVGATGASGASGEPGSNGVVSLNGATGALTGFVTQTGTQTLTNKTLTSPTINTPVISFPVIASIWASAGKVAGFSAPSGAVNAIDLAAAATGNAPRVTASGIDANISLNLTSKGTGTVQANGVDVVTTSGTQSLSNKTIVAPTVSDPALTGTAKVAQSGVTQWYQTSDQITNYERVTASWPNQFTWQLKTENGGTGSTARNIAFVTSAANFSLYGSVSDPSVGTASILCSTSAQLGTQFGVRGNLSASSGSLGIQYGVSFSPNVLQSGTAGYTALLINPTETATGSGTKRLIDAQVGGVSMFTVDNAGNVSAAGVSVGGVPVVTTTGAQAIQNKTFDSTNTFPPQVINAQNGTTYTLVLGDSGSLVTLSNASPITLTVPDNASVAFPTGTNIDLAQFGAGQVTVAGASGVTVNATPGLKIAAQYGGATLVKLGTDTWLLVGALAA